MLPPPDQRPRIRAPELVGHHGWINTPHPLTLAQLRGRVVLLDFWTYGCINCLHVIPELERLEAKHGHALVVIGVHAAKFTNEGDPEHLRRIVARYRIRHPVVNDRDFVIWRSYGVQAWPTLVLIDPEGYVVAVASGEGHGEALDEAIGQLVAEARERGTLETSPLPEALPEPPEGPLAFPGKILAAGGRLFISDSNHHRILICDPSGRVQGVVGQGEPGQRDGIFSQARFHQPQGLALVGDLLYVADTRNHLVRQVDLRRRRVHTVAGTGEPARRLNVSGTGRAVALRSPWDLVAVEGVLYIAMAGSHQIWRMDLDTWALAPHGGSGREALEDGPLREAGMNQPSGIATDGRRLFVADAEASAIRVVDLRPDGRIETWVGAGLFEFGDRDGTGREARLQHPLGIAWHEKGRLYIADTYNHKVKVLETSQRRVWTLILRDLDPEPTPAPFDEPGGVSLAGDTLYVADTNHHRIRVVDPDRGTVRTLLLQGA